MSLRAWVSLIAPVLMLVGCDHATKYVAKAELESDGPRAVIPSVLELRYVENTDMAFNLLRWIPEQVRAPLLLVLGAAGIAAVAVFLLRSKVPGAGVAGALILGGALGNYLDRLFRGYVVDFIHVTHWPVFNVADIAVSVGLGLFLLVSLRAPRGPAQLPDLRAA